MKVKLSAKNIMLIFVILALLLLIRPSSFLLYNYIQDQEQAVPGQKEGFANDASNLNETKVSKIIKPAGPEDDAVAQLTELVKLAGKDGKKIAISGSKHSMGGHTIYPDAIVLDMKGINHLSFNKQTQTLTAGAGATWAEIVSYLNKLGKSVKIMQSNNTFTVGGSISVNCHGWTPGAPPIAETVRSFRLINAQGELITCSRKINPELFSLVIGGYGLFGIIVDAELSVTDNAVYTARQYKISSAEYLNEFKANVLADPNIGMAYGRINVNKTDFMDEAILSTYIINLRKRVPELRENSLKTLRRVVFRSSADSDYGKDLRWRAERMMVTLINGKEFYRNQLMNEGVEILENHDPFTTDILHEYFVPIDSMSRFIGELKKILPKYKVDLLNITVRDVKQDKDSYLSYANEHMMGFVMLFNQVKNAKAESEMERLTQALIEAAYRLHGTYYLPYRLHATKAQLDKVYPKAKAFFELKRKYDPQEIFNNQFYKKYGGS